MNYNTDWSPSVYLLRGTIPYHIFLLQVKTTFSDVTASVLFDVICDKSYRKVWDKDILDIVEVGHLDLHNRISYYSCK